VPFRVSLRLLVVALDSVSGTAAALPFRVLLGLSSMSKSTDPVLGTVALLLCVLLELLGPLEDPFFGEPAICVMG
jgi:hypothetical protein